MSSLWKSFLTATLLSSTVLINTAALAQEAVPTAPTCTNNSYKCLRSKEEYRLEKITEGCAVQQKEVKGITYRLCRINGRIVSASEAITEAGDGIGYWFEKGNVVALRYFHDGTLVTFTGAKVKAVRNVYDDSNDRFDQPNTAARKQFEATAANGYRSIFKVFKIR